MKIALAQIKCAPGDVKSNLQKIIQFTTMAAAAVHDVIVFPEIADTGYEMGAIQKTASTWNQEPYDVLSKAASDNRLHLICGISEREGTTIYNSMAVFDLQGELIGKYRKTHLAAYHPLNEDRCFSAGNSLSLIEMNGLKLGLMICYDLRFPELSRSLVLQGAEVLVLCSAWPFPRLSHWETLIRARAIENQVYFIAANRTGTDDGAITFCGASRIVDPYGVIVTSAAEDREEMISGEISRETILAVRAKMPVLQQRRSDLYKL